MQRVNPCRCTRQCRTSTTPQWQPGWSAGFPNSELLPCPSLCTLDDVAKARGHSAQLSRGRGHQLHLGITHEGVQLGCGRFGGRLGHSRDSCQKLAHCYVKMEGLAEVY